jgi:membrane protease YdiL (CAAX protease family)
MVHGVKKERLINLTALIISGIFVAIVYLAIWAIRALIEGRLFPPQRERPVRWTGWQLIVSVLLVQLLWPSVIYWCIQQSGLKDFLAKPVSAQQVADVKNPHDEEGDDNPAAASPLDRARENLWVATVAFPFQIATIILLLHGVSRSRLADMGLTTRYFGHNLLLAALGWLLLAPAVLLLNLGINIIYRGLFHVREEEHPMMRLMMSGPSTLELVLVVVTAVVAAPMLEELLFRGVLQPWFASRNARGLIALAAALALASISRYGKTLDALQNRGVLAALQESMAVGFILLMIPGYFLAREAGRVLFFNLASAKPDDSVTAFGQLSEITSSYSAASGAVADPSPIIDADLLKRLREEKAMNQAGAIYATSLLFAAAHSFAWPTPISLFVLALGLGFLVYRTQSIVGSIVLHALFNSIAVVIILLIPQAVKGKDTTSAEPERPCVAHCNTVPGS